MKVKKADQDRIDEEWGDALDLLLQFRNPDGVLALLAGDEPVPDWARKVVRRWRAGEFPPQPATKDGDDKLLAAVRAYRDKTTRCPGETRDDRIIRIADEHDISERSLRNFLDGVGGTYQRLVRDWRQWDDIYINRGLS